MEKFIELIKDQFTYGGTKYAHNEEKESTDILFDIYGKNWMLGTMAKYCFRYKNLKRERDLLKIGCYVYMLWLKRGYHIMKSGINDPAIDTTVDMKTENYELFIERYKNREPDNLRYLWATLNMNIVAETLEKFARDEWVNILERKLFIIFTKIYDEWKENYSEVQEHDKDTYAK